MKYIIALSALMALAVCGAHGDTFIRCDHPAFGLSPYSWHIGQSADGTPSAEAPNPGAYFKTIVSGTSTIKLRIDGSANRFYGEKANVWIEYSVDDLTFVSKQLGTPADSDIYDITLAEGLNPEENHLVEVYFRSGELGPRWSNSRGHLRINGLVLDEGGKISVYPKRPKYALCFGDSITEGVGAVGHFTTWDETSPNSARVTWFPVVCEALDCEYGQAGSGGHGIQQRTMEIPPLVDSWSYLWQDTSRLKHGKLIPSPDYIFCNMGTNDNSPEGRHTVDFVTPYLKWLKDIRKAAPKAMIFMVVPPNGVHRENISTVLAKCGDKNVYIIDTPRLNNRITVRPPTPTSLTSDAVHPNEYGHALFGATVAVEAQKIIDGK